MKMHAALYTLCTNTSIYITLLYIYYTTIYIGLYVKISDTYPNSHKYVSKKHTTYATVLMTAYI